MCGVEGLGTDLADVVDAHESGGVSAFAGAECRALVWQGRAGVCGVGLGKKGAQCPTGGGE